MSNIILSKYQIYRHSAKIVFFFDNQFIVVADDNGCTEIESGSELHGSGRIFIICRLILHECFILLGILSLE